ncbi:phosphoenolpyruvate--protein phosphotransferase [Microbacterium istanbulense]|uniref:Phosphocarrier protein HPr n=1 Tax=Microbacterium istanbulense TaxID=3122049 RepID=A0ABU8LJK6_9MICO
MIGIVAVSHSAALGEAALQLAQQMVPGGGAPVRVAAGAGTDADGQPILGTDAVAVASAIDALADDSDGVIVLMDLGSALLSAELALELRMSDAPVRLVPAPFVEGLLAAVVSASAGGDLDTVAAEATGALAAKAAQLGEPEPEPATTPAPAQKDAQASSRIATVRNPQGIHARPAALIAEAAKGAEVRLRRLPDGPEAPASSLMRLLTLGARQGAEIELLAGGDDAAAAGAALDRLVALFEDGFGEGTTATDAALDAPAGPQGGDGVASAPSSGDVAAGREPIGPGVTVQGRGVSPGCAAAPVVHVNPPLPEPDGEASVPDGERDAEAAAIAGASVTVSADLRARAAAATGEAREILEAAEMMTTDPELLAEAAERVRTEGRTAARAVWEAASGQASALLALGGRMAERATDIRDVRDRLIAAILGVDPPGLPDHDGPFVLVAVDLAPADTAALDGSGCVALVTEQGGPTSHTAIIARSLGIPAVVGAEGTTGIAVGEVVLVDGGRGTIEVAPSPERIAEAEAASVEVGFDGDGRLADGRAFPLLANVGGAADAEAAAAAHAQGVGLFRTEFSFLDRAEAPTVAEQVSAYRGVLAAFPGRKVVARTLDAGSDKPLPFANDADEENPALGVRGLRIARRRPELLADQLAALATAGAAETANLEVMAPMIATVDEARAFAAQARAAGIDRVGVMIETPSAALMAKELLDVVDFVSLGTNDLAQYTLAADRLLSDLGELNDPWQPAVLRLISLVGDAGRSAGKDVGVCGEAGGDPALAPVLVGLGVTSLSMTSRALGRVAAALALVTEDDCRRAARAALGAATADGARVVVAEALG